MADFSIALDRLQGAIETGEGSATNPTRILAIGPPGNVDASGVLKRVTIEDRRAAGTRTSLRGVYSGIESSDLVLSNIPVDYDTVGWWLSLVAPSGATAPGTVDSAFTRTFTPVEGTAVNTYGTAGGYMTANLEYSSEDFASTLVYQMPAMRISNLSFGWDKRASGTDTGVSMGVTLGMSQGTATKGTAFTGSLSQTTPILAIGNQLTAYIDAAYTAIGTTSDDQVMAASFNLDIPVTYHDGMDGSNEGHTSAHYAQQWVPTFTLTRRFSDLTEFNAYTAKTTRAIRLDAVGDTIGSTATTEFRFDFVGKPTDHRITQVDGLYYAEIDFEAIYDSTLTTSWEVYTQCSQASAAYTAT